MDLFGKKGIMPMLIANQQNPFNDPGWIYELKLDGLRCIAYLDNNSSDLRNKRDMTLLPRFPELSSINKQVKGKVILDGELIICKCGIPDFYELQRRTTLSNHFKIQRAIAQLPASYVAYDILYKDGEELKYLPLIERKQILNDSVIEGNNLAISRYIEEMGIELYNLADAQKLEGVVAKKKDSRYYFDKRSKDWVKFKRIADEECIVCGYVIKKPMPALILGQYKGDLLVYRGAVQFGVKLDFLRKYNCKQITYSPFTQKEENRVEGETGITWIEPTLVCTIEYMPNQNNSLRQPVFKGIREDITPLDCQINDN